MIEKGFTLLTLTIRSGFVACPSSCCIVFIERVSLSLNGVVHFRVCPHHACTSGEDCLHSHSHFFIIAEECATLITATFDDVLIVYTVSMRHLIVIASFLSNKTGDQISCCCSEAIFVSGRRKVARLGGTFLCLLCKVVLREGYELPALLRNEIDI